MMALKIRPSIVCASPEKYHSASIPNFFLHFANRRLARGFTTLYFTAGQLSQHTLRSRSELLGEHNAFFRCHY